MLTIIIKKLFRRIMAQSNRKMDHSYRLSYALEVGSSFDPDIEDVAEWENELSGWYPSIPLPKKNTWKLTTQPYLCTQAGQSTLRLSLPLTWRMKNSKPMLTNAHNKLHLTSSPISQKKNFFTLVISMTSLLMITKRLSTTWILRKEKKGIKIHLYIILSHTPKIYHIIPTPKLTSFSTHCGCSPSDCMYLSSTGYARWATQRFGNPRVTLGHLVLTVSNLRWTNTPISSVKHEACWL